VRVSKRKRKSEEGGKDASKTHIEQLQILSSQPIPVPSLHLVNPHQQRVVHDVHLLQELCIPPELFAEQGSLLRSEVEFPISSNPVDVLEDGSLLVLGFLLGVLSTDGGSFEVVGFVDVSMGREEVVLRSEERGRGERSVRARSFERASSMRRKREGSSHSP